MSKYKLYITKSPLGKLNKLILFSFSKNIPILKQLIRFILHIEFPKLNDDKIRLPHPYNIIITEGTKIGNNITIYQNVTIGSKQFAKNVKGAPSIGDNVIIYPNTVVLGNVHIGENSIIGAGSIVTKDVDSNTIVAGNPAKKLKDMGDMFEGY